MTRKYELQRCLIDIGTMLDPRNEGCVLVGTFRFDEKPPLYAYGCHNRIELRRLVDDALSRFRSVPK